MNQAGGDKTAGSHFEERTFFTEVMGCVTFVIEIISQFTLRLVEGTSWYYVNYKQAVPFTYDDYIAVLGHTENLPSVHHSVYLSNVSIQRF